MPKPLKRHPSLHAISHEHHHGLLLAFKIREGFKLQIDPARIKKYTDWYWTNALQAHFTFEEKHIFPILPAPNKLVEQALREHVRLKRLFNSDENIENNLLSLEEELVAHIRFEERILFQEIQKIASEEELKKIELAHSKLDLEDWNDEFWKP